MYTLRYDWTECPNPDCDNSVDTDGFYPCLTDGSPTEPDNTDWENLYRCESCGCLIEHTWYDDFQNDDDLPQSIYLPDLGDK